MKILQVNISDVKGGACVISWNLHKAFLDRAYKSSIAVKYKFSDDNDVIVIENDKHRGAWFRILNSIATRIDKTNFILNYKVAALARFLSSPAMHVRNSNGVEEFDFPGARHLPVADADIIHCHILHGNYFDLTTIQEWSKKKPVLITLHDAWLLSGHCAHSFSCDQWISGCIKCPDITIPVPIKKDNAARNWKRKKKIYNNSRLYIATPCQWLMNKVDRSILSKGIRMQRVIPHGVDQRVFKKGERAIVRASMEINNDAIVLLFSANGMTRSRWKNFGMMRRAVEIIGRKDGNKIIFLALGEDAPTEYLGNAELRFIPYVSRKEDVVKFYVASDIYLHGSKADTFPNAVLEALCCGVPVVATAVGGIPEQVNGLRTFGHHEINHFSEDTATGILTPDDDHVSFAMAIEYLISDNKLRSVLGENAVADAKRRFGLTLQIENYLQWYRDIIDDHKSSVN